jgi:hypothetical protein
LPESRSARLEDASPVFYGELATQDIVKRRKRAALLHDPFDATAKARLHALPLACRRTASGSCAAASSATPGTAAKPPSKPACATDASVAPAVEALPDFARRPKTPVQRHSRTTLTTFPANTELTFRYILWNITVAFVAR